jgi:DNA-directed RNA polymerase subunit beta'
METTVGQILVNENLPEDMRDYNRAFNKKTARAVFEELADRYPDKYAEVNQAMHTLSQRAVTRHGGQASLTLKGLRTPLVVERRRAKLRDDVAKIIAGPGTDKEKNDRIVKLVGGQIEDLNKLNFDEGLKEENPLAVQVLSGSRGNPNQFGAIRVGKMLVVDHKDRPIPIPMLSSFSEGLDPVEYWAGSYGSRKGTVATKFATPKSGFLGKQLSAAAHRLVVTEKDCGTGNGLLVEAQDPDNEGTVLARKAGTLDAGDVLTPRAMRDMEGRVLVRSPMTCQAEQGICQKCAGKRERGGFPHIGDNIGIAAAQAISEPIGQGQLNVKHTGGHATSSATKSGLDLINQLVQVPKTFHGGAAISTVDGTVDAVENAPQGGKYITVADTKHWVPEGEKLAVGKGDVIEAGDVLSSGIPNPAEVTRYKGIGEGRRYFAEQFHKTLAENRFAAHRRNVEILARGLINHVRVTDLDGPADTVPDDVVEYDDIVRGYTPRFGFKTVAPKEAVGLYLEKPALHYSIGTRVTPRVAKTLKDSAVGKVTVHADEPSFVPEMTRAMETLSHSNDWMVRLGGFHLRKGLEESVHRGRKSDVHGTSFIPALAQGIEFGRPPQGAGY